MIDMGNNGKIANELLLHLDTGIGWLHTGKGHPGPGSA
jgi:hypothetical protein